MLNNLVLKKITVFVAPILLGLIWNWWLGFGLAAVEVGVASLGIIGTAIWYLTWREVAVSKVQQSLHHQEFWRFLLTPGIFTLAVYFYLLIGEAIFYQQMLILIATIVLILVLQNIFDRFYQTANYPARSFESLSVNLNCLSLFLLLATAYSFITFLDLSIWLLALAILAVVTLLTYQTMWISGIVLNKSWLYLVVTDLLIVELFWASVFLPNTYYVKALLIVVAYYLLVNLSRNHLLGLLTKTMVWRYLVIGGIILGVVLGTAQWL